MTSKVIDCPKCGENMWVTQDMCENCEAGKTLLSKEIRIAIFQALDSHIEIPSEYAEAVAERLEEFFLEIMVEELGEDSI